MIDTQAVLRMAESTRGIVVVDTHGATVDSDRLPADLHVPGLLVEKVSEAVKRLEGGRVVEFLDRDTLWSVRGFVLDAEVLGAVADGGHITPGELIDAVIAAGFEWRPILGAV
ncbi:MAG: hypothetical protein ACRDZM_16240 [Acidimicrobiia bacterium]